METGALNQKRQKKFLSKIKEKEIKRAKAWKQTQMTRKRQKKF